MSDPRAIEIIRPGPPPPPSSDLDPLSRSFTAAARDVPATHTVIELTERGQVVGSIEVMHQRNGQHLVIGEQEWHQPFGMFATGTSTRHFAAVVDRLMAEAVALADRVGAGLSTAIPGSLAPAERLRAHGFHQVGDKWYRDRPGSVVAGSYSSSPDRS